MDFHNELYQSQEQLLQAGKVEPVFNNAFQILVSSDLIDSL